MTLEIQHLKKTFGSFVAVDDLSISLKEGEVLGLLGRNGAGKTTTIKMLLELIPKDGGSVTWKNQPFKRKDVRIGYLPEERGLYPKSKIGEQLTYFAKLEGMDPGIIEQRIDTWLERFGVTEYKQKLAGELSKGNQQKIQLINTLLHDPDLIILDEPFSGLDPVNANMLSDVIQEERAKGKTLILSSHQMEQIEKFCEDIVLLKAGKVVVSGKLEGIKASYGFKNLTFYTKEPVSLDIPLQEEQHSQSYCYTCQVQNEKEGIDLLQRVSQSSSLLRFHLLEPTLQQIFVERVK